MHLMNDECVFNQASWAHGVNDFKMKLQSGLFFRFRFRTISNSYHTKYRSEDKCSAAQKFDKSLSFWYVSLTVREQK